MLNKELQAQNAKKQLLEGYGALKPGSQIFLTVNPSRTSLNRSIKVYSIAADGRLAHLTYHVAKLMRLRLTKMNRLITDNYTEEFVHYLSQKLFDDGNKLQHQVIE